MAATADENEGASPARTTAAEAAPAAAEAAPASGSYVLPARLDCRSAPGLAADLARRSGADLRIDAGGVMHLGGLGLQLLCSAAQSWRLAGHCLAIAPLSDPFRIALSDFGLSQADLEVT